jgi:hypothetical protein
MKVRYARNVSWWIKTSKHSTSFASGAFIAGAGKNVQSERGCLTISKLVFD